MWKNWPDLPAEVGAGGSVRQLPTAVATMRQWVKNKDASIYTFGTKDLQEKKVNI